MYRTTGWQQYVEAEKRDMRKLRRGSSKHTRITGLILVVSLSLAWWFGAYALERFGRLMVRPVDLSAHVPRGGTLTVDKIPSEVHHESEASSIQLKEPRSHVYR